MCIERPPPTCGKGNVNSRLQIIGQSPLVQESVVPGEEEAHAGGVDRDEAGKPDVYVERRAAGSANVVLLVDG